MLTDQIGIGGDYLSLKRSICILIADFVLVQENENYHNRYRLFDPQTGSEFTDLLEVVTLELPKLPQGGDGTALWDWLRFVGARRKEELEMLAEKNPQVAKAVAKLVELNAEERERMIADSRMKLRWDIANIKRSAEKEGREEGRREGLEEGLEKGLEEGLEKGLEKGRKEGFEKGREEERLAIARNAIQQNLPVEVVMALTGLPRETIEALSH